MLHPLGFDFQFGLQGPEVAEKDSGAGDAKWTGARVLFSVQETLHITLNPSIIRTMSALFSSCKHFYIRKEMNVFRSLVRCSERTYGYNYMFFVVLADCFE